MALLRRAVVSFFMASLYFRRLSYEGDDNGPSKLGVCGIKSSMEWADADGHGVSGPRDEMVDEAEMDIVDYCMAWTRKTGGRLRDCRT